jgi:hypothetical protein
VVVSGLTPGRSVVCFGTLLESLGYEVGSRRIVIVATANPSGLARCDLGIELPVRSIWSAVDLTTGAYVTGKPAGSPGIVRELDQRSFTAPGRLRQQLAAGTSFQEILLVRPQAGAWTLSVGDGGESDEDGSLDGHISASPAAFEPVAGATGPPERFMPGDTLIAIDPFRLRLLAAVVAR